MSRFRRNVATGGWRTVALVLLLALVSIPAGQVIAQTRVRPQLEGPESYGRPGEAPNPGGRQLLGFDTGTGFNQRIEVDGAGRIEVVPPAGVQQEVDIVEQGGVAVTAAAPMADNAVNPTPLSTAAHNLWFDGVNWDRATGDTANGGDVDVTRMPADATELPAAAALADNTVNPTTPVIGSFVHGFDGANWDRIRGTSAAGLDVNVTADPGPSAAQIPAALGPTTGAASLSIVPATDADFEVVGNVAHDAVDSGDPVKIGGKARTSNPTAVADDDRVDAYFDDNGRFVTQGGCPRDLVVIGTATRTANTEATVLAAGAAGVFHDVTSIHVFSGDSALNRIDIRDSTAGTVRLSPWAAANGGGAVMNFWPPLTQATAANNWTVQVLNATSANDIRITVVACATN